MHNLPAMVTILKGHTGLVKGVAWDPVCLLIFVFECWMQLSNILKPIGKSTGWKVFGITKRWQKCKNLAHQRLELSVNYNGTLWGMRRNDTCSSIILVTRWPVSCIGSCDERWWANGPDYRTGGLEVWQGFCWTSESRYLCGKYDFYFFIYLQLIVKIQTIDPNISKIKSNFIWMLQ